jgi:hypothetical protein
VVTRANHIRLSSRNGGQLSVELLQNRFERILPIKDVFRLLEPIVRICQISRMEHELVVVHCLGKTIDGGVIERWIDLRDHVALRLVSHDSKAISAIDTQIRCTHNGERCFVARNSRTEEMLNRRIRRTNLVVVSRTGFQASKRYSVGVCARRRICY